MMIFVLLIDGRGFGEFGKRLLSKLFKTIAVLRFPLTSGSAPAYGSLAATSRIGVDLAAQLQRDKPFHIGHVIQRARHVAMLRITFLVQRNCRGEAVDGVLVTSLAARDAAIRRMNVAES